MRLLLLVSSCTNSSTQYVRVVNVKVYDPGQGHHGTILAHVKGLKVTDSKPKLLHTV